MKTGMEPEEAPRNLDNEDQFWAELDGILASPCDDSHAAIDNVLRSYLSLATAYKDESFLPPATHVVLRCAERLLASDLFSANAEYVRRQLVYSLLQEDAADVLVVIVSLLLQDGRRSEATFEMLSAEGGFVRLLELIQSLKGRDDEDGSDLHRLLMDLMYEMARIQRIRIGDLVLVDDDFVKHLFEIIERLSDDANDPYHYPVIRVLLVLNEQFMVSVHGPSTDVAPPTNRVIKVLSMYGGIYKTFGENIILLLNREDETSLQMLTLKLLYLLFTTPSTYEYFYTNDLRVLVDILIRNLLDLPEETTALRHTYLRVLHPLLAHTQLRHAPHYKREELQKLLGILVRSDFVGLKDDCDKIMHFDEVDETTKRLVLRCSQIKWLLDEEESEPSDESVSGTARTCGLDGVEDTAEGDADRVVQDVTVSEGNSPSEVSIAIDTQTIRPTLGSAASSSLSVAEAASYEEKAQVVVQDETDGSPNPAVASQPQPPKMKPDPPQTRRSRARRRRQENDDNTCQPDHRSATHQGRTLEKQISLERVATSEPPTSHSRPHSDRPRDLSISTAEAEATPPPTTEGDPQETPTSATSNVPEIRIHNSGSPGHPHTPPAVPPPRRSSQSVPPPDHHSGPSRLRRHQHNQPPPPPPPPAPSNHPDPHRFAKSCHNSGSTPPPPPPPPPSSVTSAASSSKSNGHPKKPPEPPKTRRWWTQQGAQRQGSAGTASGGSSNANTPTPPTPPVESAIITKSPRIPAVTAESPSADDAVVARIDEMQLGKNE